MDAQRIGFCLQCGGQLYDHQPTGKKMCMYCNLPVVDAARNFTAAAALPEQRSIYEPENKAVVVSAPASAADAPVPQVRSRRRNNI